MIQDEELSVFKLTLHDHLVGYLSGYQNGRNVVSFASEFKNDVYRPTFSLITHPNFPNVDRVLAHPWVRTQRLHPVLSNLLPEGQLRELIANDIKVHVNNEFQLFSYLAGDLPGALVATAMEPDEIPEPILNAYGRATAIKIRVPQRQNKFSLAGVQMKFSMKEKNGRYTLSHRNDLGDWIIKTPSFNHQNVPFNEYTAMSLASLAGIEIPEIKLVPLDKLDNLPQINLPNETLAYAIKRFDRNQNIRIHMEDFAQIFVKYSDDKYHSTNYEQIGKVLFLFSGDGIADIQQFARRLLVNILLANGDAHIKNWSLLYLDQITPRLSPAYDILTTSVYLTDEREFALNLAKTKEWYSVDFSHFERWAAKADIPWRAIKPHLDATLDQARILWPEALKNLPMVEEHKKKLKDHWKTLQKDFRIFA